MDKVQQTFQEIARHYDLYRRKLIPCFDDFYTAVPKMANFAPDQSFRVLDLGAGTGLLTQFLSEVFPRADFTLMDFTQEMLDQARQRFAGRDNFHYLTANYAEANWAGPFDLIVSSLSIHHLQDEAKRALYHKIYEELAPGGQFLNAEFVKAESEGLQKRYWDLWIQSLHDNGLSQDEMAQAMERTQIDILTPVECQLAWLKEIGFQEVGCHYRAYLFAVFGGQKY